MISIGLEVPTKSIPRNQTYHRFLLNCYMESGISIIVVEKLVWNIGVLLELYMWGRHTRKVVLEKLESDAELRYLS